MVTILAGVVWLLSYLWYDPLLTSFLVYYQFRSVANFLSRLPRVLWSRHPLTSNYGITPGKYLATYLSTFQLEISIQ